MNNKKNAKKFIVPGIYLHTAEMALRLSCSHI